MNLFFKRCCSMICRLLFPVYLAVLVYMLFLNKHGYSDVYADYAQFIRRSVNLMPFTSMAEYVGRLIDQTINVDTVVRNLGGSFLAFMPMGFLLPCLFPGFRNIRKTFAALLILAVGTEAMQLVLWLGCFDIDTILLFVTGGMIGYGIGNIPWFRSWFRPDVMVQPIIDSTNS